MIVREKLLVYIDKILKPRDFEDVSFNGLQVEGRQVIRKIVSSTSISTFVIKEAVKRQADAILVHHGLFRKNMPLAITDVMKKRLKLLLENEINLLAYHLPLDVHPKFGNNVCIAKLLKVKIRGNFGLWKGTPIGVWGELKKEVKLPEFLGLVKQKINKNPIVLSNGSRLVKRVGLISGDGSFALPEAVNLKLDVFLTGEPAEFAENFSKDAGINVVFAGHYATEKFGVQALGQHLAKKFKLKHEFIDTNAVI